MAKLRLRFGCFYHLGKQYVLDWQLSTFHYLSIKNTLNIKKKKKKAHGSAILK